MAGIKMNINWDGKEIPAYYEESIENINFMVEVEFNISNLFSDRYWYTFDIYPRYTKNPTTKQEILNMLALKAIIKRGNILIC